MYKHFRNRWKLCKRQEKYRKEAESISAGISSLKEHSKRQCGKGEPYHHWSNTKILARATHGLSHWAAVPEGKGKDAQRRLLQESFCI